MNRYSSVRSVWFSGIFLGLLAYGTPSHGGSFSGVTRDLNLGIQPSVRVQAFEVDINGNVNTAVPAIAEVTSDPATGFYRIDVKGAERVQLVFSRAGLKTVFLPNSPTSQTGGALSGRNVVNDLDVIVPVEQAPYYPQYVYCYPVRPQHKFFHKIRFFGR